MFSEMFTQECSSPKCLEKVNYSPKTGGKKWKSIQLHLTATQPSTEIPSSLVDNDMEPEPAASDIPQRQEVNLDYSSRFQPRRPSSFERNKHLVFAREPASKLGQRVARNVKFPFAWTFHRAVGLEPIDKIKILATHLPVLYKVPEEEKKFVIHFAKKHLFHLTDGTMVVSEADLASCKDSRSWFKRERKNLAAKEMVPCLLPLEYTKENIRELDALSHDVFGRSLRKHWDIGKARAYEHLQYEKKIRGIQH